MELEQPGPRVLIRKYRYGDEKAIIRLVKEGTMMTVNPFFFSAATREMTVSKFSAYNLFIYLFFSMRLIQIFYVFLGTSNSDVYCDSIYCGWNVATI